MVKQGGHFLIEVSLMLFKETGGVEKHSSTVGRVEGTIGLLNSLQEEGLASRCGEKRTGLKAREHILSPGGDRHCV